MDEVREIRAIQGIAASPGYAIGRAFVIREQLRVERRNVDPGQLEAELEQFEQALQSAAADVEGIVERMRLSGLADEAEIVSAQLLFLQDEELIGRARELISRQRCSAASAMQQAADEIVAMIESLDDAYLRERTADIRDVAARVVGYINSGEGNGRAGAGILSEEEPRGVGQPGERGDAPRGSGDSIYSSLPGQFADGPIVLIAHELSPSQTAQLDLRAVAGIATIAGGASSHSAIIARSLGLPAVAGAGSALGGVADGAIVAVDGGSGVIVIDPPAAWLETFRAKRERYGETGAQFKPYVRRASETADGVRVELAANIGSPQEAEFARDHGAEGIGLFRTEFLFMGREELPTEEQQFEAYRQAARAFGESGGAVVIRTMDIGGDKELPLLGLPKEDNPFLGFRAIRIGLERPELLKTQLRAILRASAYGNVKAMFPMISTLAEWRSALGLLETALSELEAEGAPLGAYVERGIMVEVPAVAVQAERFAKEVDFFSIGTNDLVQYTMAADRMNRKVAHLSDPLHPAVLRLIDRVIRSAHSEGKWVGICGEMAGQPHAVPLLLAMGLNEFSMSSIAVARTRALLAQLSRTELAGLPAEALELDGAEEVRRLIEARVPLVLDYID